MGLIDSILGNIRAFTVVVTRENGTPVQGAFVRVIDVAGNDRTFELTGEMVGMTGADGQFVKIFPAPGPLPAGFYTVQVTAQGFQMAQRATVAGFTGFGLFEITVQPAALGSYAVTVPASIVSCLQPFGISIQGPAATDWQLIECTIHGDTGNATIEVPVDSTGFAYVGLDGRLLLPASMHMVPDGEALMVDPDFARPFEITLALVNANGTTPIGLPIELYAVNVHPTGATNDLSGLGGFITAPAEVKQYVGPTVASGLMGDMLTVSYLQGYYQDAIALALVGEEVDVTVSTTYIGVNGVLSTVESESYTIDGKHALRIRIPAPVSGATMAVVSVNGAGDIDPLRVLYNG